MLPLGTLIILCPLVVAVAVAAATAFFVVADVASMAVVMRDYDET